MLCSTRRALKLVNSIGPANHCGAALGLRCQSSNIDADAKSQAAKQWTPSVDPFTSAMQSKAEKELLDQVLRQAEEQEQAEDAAEQVWCKEYVWWSPCILAEWEFHVHVIEQFVAAVGTYPGARGAWWSQRAGTNTLW